MYKDTNTLVVCFEVKKNNDYEDLSRFLSVCQLPASSYGLYISFVTERDNDGISIPYFALALSRKVEGRIDFLLYLSEKFKCFNTVGVRCVLAVVRHI